MSPSSFSLLCSLGVLIGSALAYAPYPGNDDLLTFVSQPDIRAPKFDVTVHNEELVAPGYWFVSPYWLIGAEPSTNRWMPCQIGPHIYDARGELVWSGACRYENTNAFDFKAVEIDGRSHLSFILNNAYQSDEDQGHGIVLDSQYEEQYRVASPDSVDNFNMHEFNVMDDGKSALSTLYRGERVPLDEIDLPGQEGQVMDGGFFELDLDTGEVLFEWNALDYIPLSENAREWPQSPPEDYHFDYVHVNAVDKTSDGDYLLSCRFTDTIYLISGETGEIIWRLGGKTSDFEYSDFTFQRQHHVRFVDSDGTRMTISFLNNASDERNDDGTPSEVFLIAVDTSTMTANVVHRYERPDGELSRLRGSAQLLPNGNVFAGWSEQGYHSEFSSDGELLMEAKFVSDRYSSYRSFKADWTGRSSEPPAVKAMASGSTTSDLSTTVWVSWNGVTDIATWNFYGHSSESSEPILLGNVLKTGFETMFMASGYMAWVSAEAVHTDGSVIGTSEVHAATVPGNWKAAGFTEDEDPSPMDPNLVLATKGEGPCADGSCAANNSLISKEVLFGITALLSVLLLVALGFLTRRFWTKRPQPTQPYMKVASEEEPMAEHPH